MSSLAHRVGANIARHGLWAPDDLVIVAVSGGMDSVVLLHVLIHTSRWHRGRLEVATIDHGTRDGSASDAVFVQALADRHGLPCHVASLGLGDASEGTCRRARLAALYGILGERRGVIALAHHERDQAETILIQLLRGSGLAGLSAMGWTYDRRVRPLLDISHADLLRYAEENGLAWVEDPTNAEPRFLRNRVRREVLPLLDAVRPGAVGALARSATRIAADQAFLDDQLAAWGGVSEGFVDPAILREARSPSPGSPCAAHSPARPPQTSTRSSPSPDGPRHTATPMPRLTAPRTDGQSNHRLGTVAVDVARRVQWMGAATGAGRRPPIQAPSLA